MPNIIEITDLLDPALDPYARLTENQLRSRRSPDKGIFIAESQTVVTLALNAGYTPVSFLIEHSQLYGQAADLADRTDDTPIYTADGSLLEKLTGFSLSRGVLAVLRRPALPSVETVCAGAKHIAVLENIMDAANVGAIFRSAAALGIDAVLVTPQCSDPLLRRAARVSMGTVFQIPWTYIGSRTEDWPETGMEQLRSLGFQTASMALCHDTVSISDPRLKEAARLAILLGTEGTGLTETTIRLSDYTVKIPMFHGVDSLNVAAASAVAFWEICQNH
ncbi:MAG: RNA methyltransferase [Ruminococcaceae bacterium]|nr:RNA methyltransferase [Oscillospiraceae bacterium]